jgi:hypothetical protein
MNETKWWGMPAFDASNVSTRIKIDLSKGMARKEGRKDE